jgi:hypothetical protein
MAHSRIDHETVIETSPDMRIIGTARCHLEFSMSLPGPVEPLPESEDADIREVTEADAEDFLDFHPCPLETCFGDCMSTFA